MNGRNWESATRPRSNGSPLTLKTCQPTATVWIWVAIDTMNRADR